MSGRVWTGRASENVFFFRRLEFIGSCCYCLAKELILQAEYDRCEVSCGPHEYTRRDARSSHAELAVGEETTEALAVPFTYKALAGAVLAEHSCDQQKKKKEKKMLLNKTATSKDQTSILSKESQRRTSLSFLRFSGTFLCKGKAFDQPREIICEKLFNAKRIKGHVWQITVAFGVS